MKSRKRLFSLVLILSAILIIGNGQPLGATDWSVCPSGCDYTTIAAALADTTNVVAGDTVVVGTPDRTSAETYTGGFTMRDRVHVVSEPSTGTATDTYDDGPCDAYPGDPDPTVLERAKLTIIQLSENPPLSPVVRFDASAGGDYDLNGTTTLDGFTIEFDSAYPSDTYPVVTILGCSTFPQVTNCIIRQNLGSPAYTGGIGISGQDMHTGEPQTPLETAPLIFNNLVHCVEGTGIGNAFNSHATITENKIWDVESGAGIGLREDTQPTIRGNFILHTGFGSGLSAGIGSHGTLKPNNKTLNITITGNEIYDSGHAGIRLSRGDDTTGTVKATIGGSDTGDVNNIHHNGYPGIVLSDIDYAVIENNDIKNNGDRTGTVTVSGSGVAPSATITELIIKDNRIQENKLGGIYNSLDNATSHVLIEGNTISFNGKGGIRISSEGSTEIIGNDICKNKAGGIALAKGTGTITQNDISYNGSAGIGLYKRQSGDYSPNFEIIKNLIYGNGTSAYGGNSVGGGIGIYPGELSQAKPTLLIRQNKVYGQQSPYTMLGGGGIQLQFTSTTTGDKQIKIENNLIYSNKKSGIRFGIAEWDSDNPIRNNTVVGNGTGMGAAKGFGGGIIFSEGGVYTYNPPVGTAPDTLYIKNNIITHNIMAGMRVGAGDTTPLDPCPTLQDPDNLDYNLLYGNFPWDPWNSWANDADCAFGKPYPCIGKMSCVQQQYGGCYGGDWYTGGCVVGLYHDNDIMADPEFLDKDNDDYHLESDSPAITAGDDTTQMGCYGGDYPMNNLIDWEEGTGNTNSTGTYVTFDLGAGASYAITDVRLFTSSHTMTWNVSVGGSGSPGCPTTVKTGWYMNSAGEHETTVDTNSATRYIKLVSVGNPAAVPAAAICEFTYKKDESSDWDYWDGSVWRTPSIVMDDYSDIDG